MKHIIFRPGSKVGEVLEDPLPYSTTEKHSAYPLGSRAYFCGDNVKSKWAKLEKTRYNPTESVTWYWDHHYRANEQQKLQILLLS